MSTVEVEGVDVTNLKLVIQASDPQGNSITRAYSKAAAFDDPSTPVDRDR